MLIALGLLLYLLLPQPELYPPHTTFSRQVFDREGRLMHLTLTDDGKYRVRLSLSQFSPDLIAATLQHEDRHYYTHPGVNPVSLLRGLWGLVSRTPRGGGSTITMQYARLRYDLETRSIMGKVIQVFRALQLERHYSKTELLEAYLNMAPYGGNVEGAGAASLLWCGRAADETSLREAVALSVIPQSPTRRTPKTKEDNVRLAAAQHRLFQKVQAERGLRADPLDGTFTLRPDRTVPRDAPHLARRLLEQRQDQKGSEQVRTTLDLDRQRTVEAALADYLGRKREVGIRNASALLVHAPTREVLAYVGSSGFLNESIQGQVDGVTARRSPGSALKPFVYGLALDQGLIHPRTLLRDSRASFGEYNPENFDRGFAGPIPAGEALYRSRNIPAVSLAQRLSSPGLYGFMKQAGVALPKPAEHYGLSLPLGGGEVTMEELAVMYALLADDGCARPLRYAPDATAPAPGEPLLSREACFLVREMLTLREGDDPAFDDPAVHWKTGTSHRFRDAWAAGMRGEYVLIVWIGNFDGRANPAFVARECAAPLLFEVYRRLHLPLKEAAPPAGVERLELCAVSGQLPTPHCQHRLHGWFVPGVSPIAPCDIHREVLLDPLTHLRVLRDDGTRELQREVHEFWSPDLLEMFRLAGVPRREPPPFEPGASPSLAGGDSRSAPRIVSPRSALVYTIRASDPSHKTISLMAETSAGVRKVFWFAGQKFLGASEPAKPLSWEPQAGRWTVQVMDDRGQSAACQVRVEMVE